jgi:flagellar assembly protein FliH
LSKVFKSHLCVAAGPCHLTLLKPETLTSQAGELEEVVAEPTVALDLENVKEEAERLIEEARATAEQIVAVATKQSEEIAAQIKDQAEQAGFAAGRRAGLEEIRLEMAGHLGQALALLSDTENEYCRRILASEPEILKLAVAIAEKIISAELTLSQESRLALVKQALTRFDGAMVYKIRMNPADLELLTEADLGAKLQAVFSEPKTVELVADATLTPGGCFVETDHGKIDARLKSQLELISVELLKVGRLR